MLNVNIKSIYVVRPSKNPLNETIKLILSRIIIIHIIINN